MENDKLMQFLKEQFDRIDKRFDGVDKRFDSIEYRLSNIESDMKKVKESVQRLELSQPQDIAAMLDLTKELRKTKNES